VELKLYENREMQRCAVSLVENQKVYTRKFCGFTKVANVSVELIATKPASKKQRLKGIIRKKLVAIFEANDHTNMGQRIVFGILNNIFKDIVFAVEGF
jgi:hypothetical protein